MEENKFDLNTFIGFLLIGGIIVWMTWGGIGQDISTETSGSADTTIVEGPNEEVLPQPITVR